MVCFGLTGSTTGSSVTEMIPPIPTVFPRTMWKASLEIVREISGQGWGARGLHVFLPSRCLSGSCPTASEILIARRILLSEPYTRTSRESCGLVLRTPSTGLTRLATTPLIEGQLGRALEPTRLPFAQTAHTISGSAPMATGFSALTREQANSRLIVTPQLIHIA